MESALLSNLISEVTIKGVEEKMSLEILKVTLREPVNRNLILEITDENGFLLYTKPLIPLPSHPNAVLESILPEIPVNKRFIYNAFITIKIAAPAGSLFSAEVTFV